MKNWLKWLKRSLISAAEADSEEIGEAEEDGGRVLLKQERRNLSRIPLDF